METPTKDEQILQHIVLYCEQIQNTIKILKITKHQMAQNYILQNAISMPLLQIGELAKKLTNDFRENHNNIPWRAITGMRDRFAHDYGGMSTDMIFDTATQNIPILNKQCKDILKERNISIPKLDKVSMSSMNR